MPIVPMPYLPASSNSPPSKGDGRSGSSLAGYICHLAADEREPEEIDPAHLAAVLEGLAHLKRGEPATFGEVEAAFRSFDD